MIEEHEVLRGGKSSNVELIRRINDLVGMFATREEAAKVADVSIPQLRRYLSGVSQPPLSPIARMAEEKGVSLDWLWHGVGDMHYMQVANAMNNKMKYMVRDENHRMKHRVASERNDRYQVEVEECQQETIYMVPAILNAVVTAAADMDVSAEEKSSIILKAYRMLYALAPDESALTGLSAGEIRAMVDIAAKTAKS